MSKCWYVLQLGCTPKTVKRVKAARQKRSRGFLLFDIPGTGQPTEMESEAVRGYQRVGRRGMGSD